MQVQNNIASINAARNQGIETGKLKKSLEKLSSGFRIVRAGDDAAGLAISEGMRSRINSLNQAMRNIDDGIGLTNVGDGALTEVHSMLQRLKTLALKSANGTYDQSNRETLNMEKNQILEEIDRIGSTTKFGEISLFSRADANTNTNTQGWQPPVLDDTIPLQIGGSTQAGEVLDVERYYIGSKELQLDQTDFSDVKKGQESVGYIENAIEAVSKVRASFGAAYMHLDHTHNNLSVTSENMQAAESQIRDTNMAEEITKYTSSNIVLQSSNMMLTNANNLPQTILELLK
ncbi:flagellin [Clostridium sp. AM25-23AC]|jgi:flagellin|uniref:flagellin n=1 Tax=Clostridium sp. AM25-23AC TaxID=2305240 RepID=UPI000E4054D5|nr:flagellin [Clostridium sp. AM25-23AC]RGD96651.1 flagellin [Clostridium sp. AM25-23AC]